MTHAAHQPEPKQSCTKAGVVDVAACLKSDVEHALIRRSRLRQKLGNRDMELLAGGRQTGGAGAVTLDEFYFEV